MKNATDPSSGPKENSSPPSPKDQKAERMAKALRANLQRRKVKSPKKI